MSAEISKLLNIGLLSDDAGVSPQTRNVLAGQNFSEMLRFSQDTFLTFQGKEGDGLYFTVSGLFHAISHADTDVPQRLLGRIEPGEFIGELSIVDPGDPASASVKALKNSQVMKMTRESYDAFCASHPSEALEFLKSVAKQIARRLRRANEKQL